ncbi:hypothetical protein HYH03_004388 [Edaphochlamys debaryana]|uniref:Uncharacterized protein n=1 Tax=Edaphochlamys debaryana TaxID=47281 RepID=A0A836C3G4_9CHLO|nr:hypothetical protein HYH03_004388 [Edaphochlamys debaryana]|eukprot:KAG2497649.1 hypothetical protein HYH03_004388 [Edaphochlamys debaryana]
MQRELGPWEDLPPHVREILLRAFEAEEQSPADLEDSTTDGATAAETTERQKFAGWLSTACRHALPPHVAVDSGFTCDLAHAGGRALLYRQRTLLVLGGRASGTPSAAPGWPKRHTPDFWVEPGRRRKEGGTAAAVPDAHPLELRDHSRVHSGQELGPLRGPARLLLVAGSRHYDAELPQHRPGSVGLTGLSGGAALPAVEGCAAASYGACVLVHGGITPEGVCSGELRALLMAPDPHRYGEYGVSRVAPVLQDGEAEGWGLGADGGALGGGPGADRAWWQPLAAAGAAAAAKPAAATEPGTSDQTAGAAECADLDGEVPGTSASRPCCPPSARYGHHLVVDRARRRLWLLGGCRVSLRGGGTALTADEAPPPPRPADPQPCLYWATLPEPSMGGADRTAGTSSRDGNGAAAEDGLGLGRGSGASCSPFAGGDAAVRRLRWWRLPLRPELSAAQPSTARNPPHASPPPALPDPLRTAAATCVGGALYVLSSGVAPGPGTAWPATTHAHAKVRQLRAPAPSQPVWLLHRIDPSTGACSLVTPQPPSKDASSSGCSSTVGAAAPAFHEDAVAMADDALPYLYVYGSRGGAAASGAANGTAPSVHAWFEPCLHRLDLAAPGGPRWEAVAGPGAIAGAVVGGSLHVTRQALGAASAGSVVLVGGIQDARRGVESRVQLVLPTVVPPVKPGAAAAAQHQPHPDDLAAARCRRVLAERLRRVAPLEARFAHPDPDPDRPSATCAVALAAALALYSRGGLFDECFLETLEEQEADGDSGGGGCGGGPSRGMTVPGHEPLAVAAAAAWVAGRTAVRPDWDVRFVAQLHDLGRLWEMPSLQRECVRCVARRGAALPLPQLPAALGLAEEVRRAEDAGAPPAPRPTSEAGGGDAALRVGPGSEASVSVGATGARALRALAEQWRKRLARAAASGEITLANLEEVMGAAWSGDAEGGAGCTAGGRFCPRAALRRACEEVAAAQLAQTPGEPAAARQVAVFACRRVGFGLERPLLLQAMRWWDRRLALPAAPRDGATLPQLALLLSQLQDLEAEQRREERRRRCHAQALASAFGGDAPPAKRAKGADGDGAGAGADESLAQGLRAFLLDSLRRRTRAAGALAVLQVFGLTGAAAVPGQASGDAERCHQTSAASPSCGTESPASLPPAVVDELYSKLAALPPAQLLQLPPEFRTPGKLDWSRLERARKAAQQKPACAPAPGKGSGDADAAACSSLARRYAEWRQEQEEQAKRAQGLAS